MFGKQKQMGRWIAIAVATGLVWASHVSAQKPVKPPKEEPITYTIVELSNLRSQLNALNQLADGVVEAVGFVSDNSGEIEVQRASHWLVESSGAALVSILSTLPPLDPEATVHAVAVDVNNYGVIIGSQRDTSDPGGWRPLLWPDALSDPVALQLPAVAEAAIAAVSINDEGIVVGRMYAADGTVSTVAWKVVVSVDDEGTARATVQDTIVLNVPDCRPTQIVNSGYVSAIVRDGGDRAVRLQLAWDHQQVWELESSRAQLFDVYSRAAGVNEAGIVCGSYRKDGQVCAFVKNLAGDLIDLPTLPGGRLRGLKYDIRNMAANGLNNASPLQVIGMASKSTTVDHQWLGDLDVLWNVGGTAVDITPDEKFGLYDINDAGWIAGTAPAVDSGVYRAVVLIPSR